MSRRFDPRTWLGRRVGTRAVANSTRSAIRSVQQGSVTLNGSVAPVYTDVTITAVDPLMCSLDWLGRTAHYIPSNNSGHLHEGSLALTSATNLRVSCHNTYNPYSASYINVVHGWRVVEFHPDVVKQIQSGVYEIGAGVTSATATFTKAVVPLKTLINIGGQHGNSGSDNEVCWAAVAADGSGVTFTRYTGAPAISIGWRVIEFW